MINWLIQFQTVKDSGTRYYGVIFLSGLLAPSLLIQITQIAVHFTVDFRIFWFLGGGFNLALYNPKELANVASQ